MAKEKEKKVKKEELAGFAKRMFEAEEKAKAATVKTK